MRIFFEHKLVGSPVSFVWEDGDIVTNDSSPCDWRLESDSLRQGSLLHASEAAGCNLVVDPVVPQAQFWKKHTQHPAWCRILPKAVFSDHLKKQVESVVSFVNDPGHAYFLTHFQKQQALLDSLQTGRVRDDSLEDSGFSPDPNGFVPVPVYDNSHSATGRMSITAGPKILTLPKERRSNLRSQWDDGVLVEIDFNALEARVLSWIARNDPVEGDMYEWIGSQAGTGNVPRAVVKEATLAAIYGMSRRNFALRYQDMPDAVDVYESVRKIMRVQDLDSRLRDMNPLRNAFGRPLPDTTAKISYHVQSSAVDIACHGFLWLVSQLDKSQAVPIYVIHDALVLDIRKQYISHVEGLCKDGLEISIMKCNLPIKIRSFNHE